VLQAAVNRQNLLRESEDLLDVHPEIMPAQPMVELLEEVWCRIMNEEAGGTSAGPFTAWEAAMLERIEQRLLRPRRVTSLLMAGCANPFLVQRLWKGARIAVFEADATLCHWVQGLVSRWLLIGQRGAVSVESRAVTFLDAMQTAPRAFDLIWFGPDFWETWADASQSELLTAMGQLSGRVEYLAVSVQPDRLEACRRMTLDAGYAVEEEWREGSEALPVTLLVRNPAVSASGAFYIENASAVFDPVVEELSREGSLDRHRTAGSHPMASPSAGDPGAAVPRVRIACAASQVIVSFHSPMRSDTEEQISKGRLIWSFHSLRGICPQLPPLTGGTVDRGNQVVLGMDSMPVLLSDLEPGEIAWERLLDEVMELAGAVFKRGYFLNSLRPGWFVWTREGLRLCVADAIAREETEDALSSIWWFFHDLAACGPRWRAWPVPPPGADLPAVIPAGVRGRISRLMECASFSEALRITPVL
jgi:hypothetical protein